MNHRFYSLFFAGLFLLSGQVAVGMQNGDVSELVVARAYQGNPYLCGFCLESTRTNLHKAIAKCLISTEDAEQVLIANPEDINAQDYKGNTPLHYTAYHAQPEGVRVFCIDDDIRAIESGDTNYKGSGPIYAKRDMAKILIDHGADVTVKNCDGKTFLKVAREEGKDSFVKEIERYIEERQERLFKKSLRNFLNQNRHDEDQERRGVKPRTSRCLLFNCVVRTQDERL